MNIYSLVTTKDRPAALARSLPQILALGWPCVVVNDGGCDVRPIVPADVPVLTLPQNRGLAAALNCGLGYLLADARVDWVSYFQDDVDLHPTFRERMLATIEWLRAANKTGHYPLITGHDANEHEAIGNGPMSGTTLKGNCRATHLLAPREYWLGVMPIPTRKLGAPCREPNMPRGTGSHVDFWIARESPNSVVKRGGHVFCVPGAVRTFYHRAADSCWDNDARGGADAEFAL